MPLADDGELSSECSLEELSCEDELVLKPEDRLLLLELNDDDGSELNELLLRLDSDEVWDEEPDCSELIALLELLDVPDCEEVDETLLSLEVGELLELLVDEPLTCEELDEGPSLELSVSDDTDELVNEELSLEMALLRLDSDEAASEELV